MRLVDGPPGRRRVRGTRGGSKNAFVAQRAAVGLHRVTDKDQLAGLAEVWVGAHHIPGSAATIALVTPIAEEQRTRESIQFDLGQATMSIMLAAADLGIGTGHSAVRDQDKAREMLEFPEDRFCALLIGTGYPADRALQSIASPARRDFEMSFIAVVSELAGLTPDHTVTCGMARVESARRTGGHPGDVAQLEEHRLCKLIRRSAVLADVSRGWRSA